MNTSCIDLDICTNDAFYPLYDDQTHFLVLLGGAGSGKSVFASQKVLYRILTERGHRILIVRKVAKTIRQSVFVEMRERLAEWGVGALAKINHSEMRIDFPALDGQILFVGCDDVEKLKSVSGITSMWIEEATELAERDLEQLNIRMRSNKGLYEQIILTFNPVSDMHWLKRRFFDVIDPTARTIKTTYADNRFLTSDYRDKLEAIAARDPLYHQIYARGEWGQLTGLIYTNWDPIAQEFKPEDFNVVYWGVDFGFNDPSVILGVGMRDGDCYVFYEYYERNRTNADLGDVLKPLVRGAPVTCDSQDAARISDLQMRGINAVPAAKGADSVRAGIDWLKQRKIYICESCINTRKEISLYKWREDRHGNTLDEPIGLHDHALDALRYAVEPLRLQSGGMKAGKIQLWR